MRHGFLLIDKPKGPTSHDIVAIMRKMLGEPCIGHLGTLDPLATGLLVLAVGKKALKTIELFSELGKTYKANIRLGSISKTYDSEGPIETVQCKTGWQIPELPYIQRIMDARFQGTIEQTPPLYSAIKTGGIRAYRRARQGLAITLPPRKIEIQRCTIVHYAYPDISLIVECGAGTYIRSLAHDLGQLLHCGGYVAELHRTRVGDWSIDHALPPEKVQWTRVIPLKEILRPLNGIELTAEEARDIRVGKSIAREVKPQTIGWFEDLPIVILEPKTDGSRLAHPRKVFL